MGKISALTPGTPAQTTDLIPAARGTGDVSLTIADIAAAAPIQSVAGRTGAIVLSEADIANLTADLAAKATATNLTAETNRATSAEALLAPLASPTLTGNPIVPTQAPLTNSTRAASTAYADAAVAVEASRAVAAEATKQPLNHTLNTQAASYTAVLADNGKIILMNTAGASAFTVPPNASVAFPTGATITVIQQGAGQATLTPGAGVTLLTAGSLTTRAQNSIVYLTKIATDTWVAAGDFSGITFGSVISNGLMAQYPMTDGAGSTLADSSGNSNNGTLATSTAAPAWLAAPGGGLAFVGANGQYVALPAALNTAKTIMLFIAFEQQGNTIVNQAPIAGSVFNNSVQFMIQNFSTSVISPKGKPDLTLSAFGLPYSADATASRLFPQGINSVTLAMSAKDHVYVNGYENSLYYQQGAQAGKQSAGVFQLGGATDGTSPHNFFYTGKIYYALFYSRVLSPAEIAQNHVVVAAILQARGLTISAKGTGTDNTVVIDGDSISNGHGLTGTWGSNMALTGAPSIWVSATDGGCLQYQDTNRPLLTVDAPYSVDPFFEAQAAHNTCVIFAGTNDLTVGSATPAQTYAALKTYCLARKAAGWTVFVGTMISRGGTGVDANKNTYNTSIRGDFSSGAPAYADALLDFAANPSLGADGANANTTYFQDFIHPTATGAAILTSIGQTGLNRFYGNSSFGTAHTYTASATQGPLDWYTVFGASAGGQTFTLLSSIGYTNQYLYMQNTDTHAWTVAGAGAEVIGGNPTVTVNPGATLILQCTLVSASAGGSNWTIIRNS